MRNRLILASAAALLSLSATAYAQDTVIIQETDPVMTESTVVVPGEVRTYVLERDIPSVPYEGDILIGRVVPGEVEIHAIDGQPDYAYTIVNERRVIVNPQTRTVIQVLE
ncbi:DUF1236 domain-containing protein [Shinella sp. PSBB067]|uniref:DUF1236 domain-containing protein n=1 Tax=unclassified Shinella TaxID=2643062 RepID=UPI0009266805|nr:MULTISPECIES: DUF1236 domain-containing protein [unclassified Shinella]MBN9052459.1 DUF1236 domain-containing protein [Hyphomicrobiales bacterium]OJU86719.1 MAG: hypothetical protein BGO06_14845 [Shinella sp. 65-6]QRI64668.1 DUF1236 domain-containing protein [Shinella sp. PSBB067]